VARTPSARFGRLSFLANYREKTTVIELNTTLAKKGDF